MIEEAHGNIPQSVVHEMSAGLPPDLGPHLASAAEQTLSACRRQALLAPAAPAPAATNRSNSGAGSTRADRLGGTRRHDESLSLATSIPDSEPRMPSARTT